MTARGEEFERIIENVAKVYRLQGRAYIFKRPVEKSFKEGKSIGGRVVGSKVNYHGRAGVDFNGFLCGSGRFIAFEAKQVSTKDFNLQKLQRHQLEELKFIHQNGGLAYLLINFKNASTDQYFLVPYEYVAANVQGYSVRRKKQGSRVKVVEECVGVLHMLKLIEQGFGLKKNAANVYVDILGGVKDE